MGSHADFAATWSPAKNADDYEPVEQSHPLPERERANCSGGETAPGGLFSSHFDREAFAGERGVLYTPEGQSFVVEPPLLDLTDERRVHKLPREAGGESHA